MSTRFVHLHVVIAEPVDASTELDGELAKSVRAVLRDNGYAVDECEPVAQGPDALTAQWPMWARQLDALLTEAAAAQRAATVAHAETYMATDGTQQFRAAAADLAAAAAVESHATLAGRAEAFRMVLATHARRDAHSAPPERV